MFHTGQSELYRFEKYTGQETEVQLPDEMDGKPLGIIGCKAFLSCKTVEKLYLPKTLEAVEDWGFAHMKNLQELILPAKKLVFGKQVFLGCECLRRVRLYTEGVADVKRNASHNAESYEGMPYFFATMCRFFPEEKLLNPAFAGDLQGQWKWLADYDEALISFIRRPHDAGFVPAFIGWFDVEDVDDQKARYMMNQRKEKIRLAFQRLQYGRSLQKEHAKVLHGFLLRESELVEVLILERSEGGKDALGQELSHYKIWQQSGGLDRQRAEMLLQRLPEEAPEIRGYLLNMQLENVEKVDFFGELEL